MAEGQLMSFIINSLLKKVRVPKNFHDQATVIEEMLSDDVSGLINSLTDFAVSSATGDFSIETKNEKFTSLLKEWLDNINSEYRGRIPSGIKSLAKEYFKERWQGASFPVLRIAKWGQIRGVMLPTKLFFVDGGSIYAKDENEDENLKLINYNYELGISNPVKLDKNCIFANKSGRWFSKYPTPYLVKNGVYHNFQIIKSLKERQEEILDQVIPYMMLIKKGTESLATENVKTYTDKELKEVVNQFQDLMDKIKTTNLGDTKTEAPVRATQFDENIEHVIPDLKTIFQKELFEVAEREILSGLGFIDVIQGISSTRKESVLNPKIFIQEVKSGVDDFKQILKELVLLIKEKNKNHRKYISAEFYINSSPIKGFMTDSFKELIRSLYDRGRVSSQTAVELIGEVDFATEVYRREKEEKEGISKKLYPPVTINKEGSGIDLPSDVSPEDKENIEKTPEEKKNEVEKQNYNMSKKELETAPYTKISELPPAVKKLSPAKKKVWMDIFNNAYHYMLKKTGDRKKAETYAFKVAWSKVKQVKSKNKSKVKKAKTKEILFLVNKAIEKMKERKGV